MRTKNLDAIKSFGKRESARTNNPAIQDKILALLAELKAGSRYLRRLMVKKNGRFLLIE